MLKRRVPMVGNGNKYTMEISKIIEPYMDKALVYNTKWGDIVVTSEDDNVEPEFKETCSLMLQVHTKQVQGNCVHELCLAVLPWMFTSALVALWVMVSVHVAGVHFLCGQPRLHAVHFFMYQAWSLTYTYSKR